MTEPKKPEAVELHEDELNQVSAAGEPVREQVSFTYQKIQIDSDKTIDSKFIGETEKN